MRPVLPAVSHLQNFAEQFGYDPNEYLGNYVAKLKDENDYAAFAAIPAKVIDGLRCFAALGIINIPEPLGTVVRAEPLEVSFDWYEEDDDAGTKELCMQWLAKFNSENSAVSTE